jgi:hypothetical protein
LFAEVSAVRNAALGSKRERIIEPTDS